MQPLLDTVVDRYYSSCTTQTVVADYRAEA